MTYPGAIKYLNSFIDYERVPQYPYKQSLKLERIKEFLETLDNPQDDLKCIHIAGTKGKGSTCAFVSYILREAGFKTGLYTSPHLSDFRERIRILNPDQKGAVRYTEFEGMISEKELTDLVEETITCIEEYNSRSRYGALSFFEVYTALAFKYFKRRKVDFAVLETGLGGKLDATNAVNSLIAAITPISYEHTRLLGGTLAEIAGEKAGIIKNNPPPPAGNPPLVVISARQDDEVIGIIRDRCRKQNATLYELGRDIVCEIKERDQDHQRFNINGALGEWADLSIRLLGKHQIENAALAVAVISALIKFYQLKEDPEALRAGLYNAAWPGRFEIISETPLIALDGAQNVASAGALRETIAENFPGRNIILVLGISQDKDIKGICEVLMPISNEIILTQADNPRAADVDMIEQVLMDNKQGTPGRMSKIKSPKDAIELIIKKAGKEDLILITGSLFLVGEARDFLLKDKGYAPDYLRRQTELRLKFRKYPFAENEY